MNELPLMRENVSSIGYNRTDLLIVAANRDATRQKRKKPHRTFPGHATSAEQKPFCFASLHFLCRRSVDVPVDVQTHLLFGPHTQAVLRLRVSRAAATREVPMRGVPQIPSQRWRTSAHTDNLHISRKSSTRCLSSLTRQAGETARRAAKTRLL